MYFFAQHGDTALHIACMNNHDDTVEALISAHADIDLRNKVWGYMLISWFSYDKKHKMHEYITTGLRPRYHPLCTVHYEGHTFL